MLSIKQYPADDIIQRLQAASWHPQSAISLASTFNDMELSPPQLDKVCDRMINQLADLDVEETPPFIYQLLLLSRKGLKRLIISSICNHFITLNSEVGERTTAPIYRRMEGTVMLHILFAIKLDQDLGQELIKYVRTERMAALETFPIACLLSAARIHRFSDTIYELLRGNIISSYKDSDKLKQCAWISEFSRIDTQHLHKVMIKVAENSAHGWDQLIQPLTQLAMLLIDYVATNATLLKLSTSSTPSSPPKQGPIYDIVKLGSDILTKMFRLHSIVRSEILEQITARIVSHSPSTMYFLDLLEDVVAQSYYAIDPYIPKLRNTLDYLPMIPYVTAERLLKAIQPVATNNDQFRDGLMLVLRKSMFSKDLNGRMVSVNGFLALLSDQFSQENGPRGIAFEILGLLRRCFNQQVQVRANAYKGLADLSRHHDIASDIFEVLYAQFLRVFEKDRGVTPPIRLDACVENARNGGYPKLCEPVHILLASLTKTMANLRHCPTSTVVTDQIDKCRQDIKSLIARLSKSDLEDFELDKTATFDLATHIGLRNNIYAGLLQGVYEATMEYEYMTQEADPSESYQTTLSLFKKRMDAAALLKEGSSGDKGRKSATLQSEYSVASLDFLTNVTRRMFMEGNVQRPIRALRGDLGYVKYIVQSTQIVLKKMTKQHDRDFEKCLELAKLYMDILKVEDSDSSFVNHQSKKGHSVLESMLDTFMNICDTVHQLWPKRLVNLLSQISGSPGGRINTVIFNVVKLFEEIMTKYLSDRSPLYREAAKLMQIVVFLSKRLDRDADDFRERTEQMTLWLGSIVKERPVEDIALAREIIHLHIHLCAEIGDFMTVIYIAQDLHSLHGDIDATYDQEEYEQPEVQYMMMNVKTCNAITIQLLSFLDECFDNLNWCIGRLKLAAASDDENLDEFDSVICQRTLSYLSILAEFTKAVLLDAQAESLIKTLTRAYKTLTTLVKYKYQRHKEISQDFVSVIMIAGTRVTDKMYRFLTIYGQHQSDSVQKKTGVASKKEKAKIVRELKLIPGLIFVVEQFERHLIQLSRKSKVDLMQYMKRSTSRDFKIDMQLIQADQEDDEPGELSREKVEAMQNFLQAAQGDEGGPSKRQRMV
ncbi:FANCI solenoid 4-domain-containing protein [Fennellomyces sp. T-0311]|nr:FANCI solenoid 4-domain-containing protein [Fennellomyces sp. T-0311]